MLHGLPRRSTAIATGALLLSAALSSCGFSPATNRINTISSGINNQEGEVDVLGAAIISGAPDTGLFVATLANGNQQVPISLTTLAGDVSTAETLDPVSVAPLGLVNLYDTGGIALSGTIVLGDFIDVELTFDSGQTSTLTVAVMRPCYEYDPDKFPDMELPGGPPAGETEFEAETLSESTDEGTKLTDPYSCDPIEPESYGGEPGAEPEE